MSQSRFHTMLEAKILAAMNDRKESIASGGAADYSTYMESVGYILGLKDALVLCSEVERELDS